MMKRIVLPILTVLLVAVMMLGSVIWLNAPPRAVRLLRNEVSPSGSTPIEASAQPPDDASASKPTAASTARLNEPTAQSTPILPAQEPISPKTPLPRVIMTPDSPCLTCDSIEPPLPQD